MRHDDDATPIAIIAFTPTPACRACLPPVCFVDYVISPAFA